MDSSNSISSESEGSFVSVEPFWNQLSQEADSSNAFSPEDPLESIPNSEQPRDPSEQAEGASAGDQSSLLIRPLAKHDFELKVDHPTGYTKGSKKKPARLSGIITLPAGAWEPLEEDDFESLYDIARDALLQMDDRWINTQELSQSVKPGVMTVLACDGQLFVSSSMRYCTGLHWWTKEYAMLEIFVRIVKERGSNAGETTLDTVEELIKMHKNEATCGEVMVCEMYLKHRFPKMDTDDAIVDLALSVLKGCHIITVEFDRKEKMPKLSGLLVRFVRFVQQCEWNNLVKLFNRITIHKTSQTDRAEQTDETAAGGETVPGEISQNDKR